MSRFWTFIFRAVIVLALAGHVFYMYNIARMMLGGFGVDLSTFVLASLFSAAMLIPFFWVAWLPDVPELLVSRRAMRRFHNDECPKCGYTLGGIDSVECPECGSAIERPLDYEWSWRPVRRFVALTVLALCLGILIAESLITCDELSFRRRIATLNAVEQMDESYLASSRRRIWPNGDHSMVYHPEDGFTSMDQLSP